MTVNPEAAQKLAQELKARNDLGESWRKIAESYGNPVVKAGTLCRIASEAGEWLPHDRKILRALGLLQRTEIQKKIDRMVERTRRSIFRRNNR